jgi:hypothetical protein
MFAPVFLATYMPTFFAGLAVGDNLLKNGLNME